jgi:hypothetical protein
MLQVPRRALHRSFLSLVGILNWPGGRKPLFVVTLYTEAYTPWALCSEKSRMCSLPTLIPSHTPSVNIVETRTWRLFYTKPLSTL